METQEKTRKRDTIEAKIERLKKFTKKYPYAFSKPEELKKKWEAEGKKEEAEKLSALYKGEYTYLRVRNSQGKIPEKEVKQLQEGKVGGIFQLAKEDKAFQEKMKLSEDFVEDFVCEFGSIKEFRKIYLQYRIELANASNIEEVRNNYPEMSKYIAQLPLTLDFYFDKKEPFEKLLNALIGRKQDCDVASWVFDKGINEELQTYFNQLPERTKDILESIYEINGREKETYVQLGEKWGVNKTYISQIIHKEIGKLHTFFEEELVQKKAFRATEEMICQYFDKQDIWEQEEQEEIQPEDRIRFIALVTERKEELQQEPEIVLEPEVRFDEVNPEIENVENIEDEEEEEVIENFAEEVQPQIEQEQEIEPVEEVSKEEKEEPEIFSDILKEEVVEEPAKESESDELAKRSDSLQREVDFLKIQKETMMQDLEALLEKLRQGTKQEQDDVAQTISRLNELLKKQEHIIESISQEIGIAQNLEKTKQEERAILRNSAEEKIQEGE